MLIPSRRNDVKPYVTSLSRRVNANSQPKDPSISIISKLIKKGEC